MSLKRTKPRRLRSCFPRTRGDEPGPQIQTGIWQVFSTHARGSKSMLSHCYLPPDNWTRSLMVYIQSKPSLAFLINPCYARPVGLVPSARLEITARFNAGAEGPTFAYGKGSQSAHQLPRAGLGSLAFVMPEKPGTRSSRPRANSTRTPTTRLSPHRSNSGVTLHSSPSFIGAIEHSSRITTKRSSIRWCTDHGSIVLR